MKKSLTASTFVAIALAAWLIFGSTNRSSASANAENNESRISLKEAAMAMAALAPQTSDNIQSRGINPPLNTNLYALTSNNTIYVLRPGAGSFAYLTRPNVNGNLIGFDFRPADNNNNTAVYALTDTGVIYKINVAGPNVGAATRISTLSPNFNGGFQSVFDFNPAANALRIQGANNQNYAAVNSNGGNLNTTAVQTALVYARGDVNQGQDPSISGGAYTNNLANATSTIYYAVDTARDTFVTIAKPLTATGSSNTGGGQLQTIGNLVNPNGQRINFAPDADFDCYSDPNSVDIIFGVSGLIFYQIDLGQINPNLQLGQTQNVVVKAVQLSAPGATGFIDLAVPVATPAAR